MSEAPPLPHRDLRALLTRKRERGPYVVVRGPTRKWREDSKRVAIANGWGWVEDCGCTSDFDMCATHGCKTGCGGVRLGDGDFCGGEDGERCDPAALGVTVEGEVDDG